MSVIFISYSRKDSAIADEIRDRLINYELEAITPWQDKKDMRGGERWHLEIDRAIQDTFAMLIICTENSKSSPNVTYEWAYARGLGNIALIPIFFDRVDDRVPIQLQVEQGYDFNDSGLFWSRLILRLRELQINDSRTNVRILWNVSNYIRELAVRAFYKTQIDDNLAAVTTLSTVDDPMAREILMSGLNHPQTRIRDHILAQMVLSGFNDVRLIPKLKEFLLDENVSDWNTSTILGSMGKETVKAILPEARNENPEIQRRVLYTLAVTGESNLLQDLTETLNNQTDEWLLAFIEHTFIRIQQLRSIEFVVRQKQLAKNFEKAFDSLLVPILSLILSNRGSPYVSPPGTLFGVERNSLTKNIFQCLEWMQTAEAIKVVDNWRRGDRN